MPWWSYVALFGGMLLLAVVHGVIRSARSHARSRSIRELASKEGWDYEADGTAVLRSPIGLVPSLRSGRRPGGGTARNLVRGRAGAIPFLLFDHEYGGGQYVGRRTMAVIQFDETVSLPAFALHPTWWFRGSILRGYNVQVNPANAIERLNLAEAGSILSERRVWSIEGFERWLVVYQKRHVVPPGELAQFVQSATTIAELIPV